MPNFTDRVPQGAGSRGGVGAYPAERLPNITGSTYMSNAHGALQGISRYTGCFSAEDYGGFEFPDGGADLAGNSPRKLIINASLSSSVYKDGAPVQQAATVVNFCIRY